MTRSLHRGGMIIASVILGFAVVVFLAYAANLITFPFDYDQGEGFELVDTIMFSEFQYPYQNTETFPFYSSNYPPLYHVILAPFVWVFGAGYWYGRLVSALMAALAAGAIGYAVQRDAHSRGVQWSYRWIALLAGMAFLASNTVYHIAPLFRQHIAMVGLEVVAVVILARAFPQRRTASIALGLLLIIAAGYTKQLAAFTAIAVLAWMILRNPRRGIVWSIAFTIVGAGVFAWLVVDTGGEWWRQAIVANVNAFNPFQSIGLTILWFKLHGFLIVPAALYTLYELYFERLSLYSVWFIVTTIFGAVGSGTWGAGDSYFATSIAAMCILSGIFFSRWLANDLNLPNTYLTPLVAPLRRLPMTSLALIIVPVLYSGYGMATFKMPVETPPFAQLADTLGIEANVRGEFYDSASHDVVGYANIGYFVSADDHRAGWEIVERINATNAPVLSEEAGFVLAAEREVITNPTQLLNLWKAGEFEGDALLDMIESRQFGLIILRAQFYPTPILEAIGQHYRTVETIEMNHFSYLLLRPNAPDTD